MALFTDSLDEQYEDIDVSRQVYRRAQPAKMRRPKRFSRTRGGARFNGVHRRRNKRWSW